MNIDFNKCILCQKKKVSVMNFFLICYFLLIRGAIERYFRTRMQDNMNFVRNVSLFSGKECARQFLPASERAEAEATGTGSQIFFWKIYVFQKCCSGSGEKFTLYRHGSYRTRKVLNSSLITVGPDIHSDPI